MVFNILIFAKLVFFQLPYVGISCTNCHPDRSRHVESADRISLSPLSTERLQLTQFHQRLFEYFNEEILYQISSNSTRSLIGGSGSEVLVL